MELEIDVDRHHHRDMVRVLRIDDMLKSRGGDVQRRARSDILQIGNRTRQQINPGFPRGPIERVTCVPVRVQELAHNR